MTTCTMLHVVISLNFKDFKGKIMKKKIIIGSVSLITLSGFLFLYGNKSAEKIDKNVSTAKNVIRNIQQEVHDFVDENLSTKKVFAKITKKKSVDTEKVDSEDEEEFYDNYSDCEEIIKIPGAFRLCGDNDKTDFRYEFETDGTTKDRILKMKQTAYDAYFDAWREDQEEESRYSGIDVSLATHVCDTHLIQDPYGKSGQDDKYKVFFCDDNENKIFSTVITSGGIDEDGVEHFNQGFNDTPFPASVVADSQDGEGYSYISASEIKKQLVLEEIQNTPLPSEVVKSQIQKKGYEFQEKIKEVFVKSSKKEYNSENQFAYEILAKDKDGNDAKLYVVDRTGAVFTEQEYGEFLKYRKQRNDIFANLSDSAYYSLLLMKNDDAVDKYIDKHMSTESRKYLHPSDTISFEQRKKLIKGN